MLPLGAADTRTILHVPQAGVSVEALERALIAFTLARTAGNRARAARLLRLTRSALLYRMHKYRLEDLAFSSQDATTVEGA